MRKSSPKEKSQRLTASAVRAVLALLVVGLLAVPIAVQAELKATNLAYAWDTTRGEFFWGHATIEWNGTWVPLLQNVQFDDLERPSEPPDPPLCADDPDATTRYAGWIEYGLPSEDSDPEYARGFLESRGWTLIDCDLNGDDTWDAEDDLQVGPDVLDAATVRVLATCSTDEDANCRILPNTDPETNEEHPWLWDLPQDPTSETEEHCAAELATRLWISVDKNCDGAVDDAFLDPETGQPEPICVYAEALTPLYEEGEPVWTFPLPVRISDADGAKTLMLYPSPTAVELASFGAELQGRDVVVSWQTATEQDNLGFNLYRTNSAGGDRVQLNERLIPSQNLGSTVGSSYQFVDRTAEPDTAYHYWLEDVDLSGAGGMNGPASVQTPLARLLPCRPRPAPIPPGEIQ